MSEQRTPTEARSAERGKRTLVVMLVSTLAAAAIAIAAYVYVSTASDEELADPIPEAEDALQSEPTPAE